MDGRGLARRQRRRGCRGGSLTKTGPACRSCGGSGCGCGPNQSSICSFHNDFFDFVRKPLERRVRLHFLPSQSSGGRWTWRRSLMSFVVYLAVPMTVFTLSQ